MNQPARFYPYVIVITLGIAAILSTAIGATTRRYGLEDFLTEVAGRNQAYQASRLTSLGAAARMDAADTLTAPQFFVEVQRIDDRFRQALFPVERSEQTIARAGFRKTFDFGLSAELSYRWQSILQSPIFPEYDERRPEIQLSQSLWKNAFGRLTRATVELQAAQALSQSLSQSYQMRLELTAAEAAYWRLAYARKSVQIQRESLTRAQELADYYAKRARLQLSDRSDALQAQAALETRRLQYQTAIDQERELALAFNAARGIEGSEVSESLVTPSLAELDRITPPARQQLREDVRAAQANERAQIAQAEISRQNLKPDLEIFGSYSLQSRSRLIPSAFGGGGAPVGEAPSLQPTLSYGLRFTTPLNLGPLNRAWQGADQEQQGARLAYQRKLFEQEREWRNQVASLNEARARLRLARTIESVQGQKLEVERKRRAAGRSTTYQVLLFEQDYATAQTTLVQAQSDVMTLSTQLKLFQENTR